MPDLYLISASPIVRLGYYGAFNRVVFRPLTDSEKIAIEDKFFNTQSPIKLPPTPYLLVLPDLPLRRDPELVYHYASLAEFSLSIAIPKADVRFAVAAIYSNGQFLQVNLISSDYLVSQTETQPVLKTSIAPNTAAQWIHVCLQASRNIGNKRTHIIANRYLRAVQSKTIEDSLLDLTICLESVLDAKTEISFRFGLCLAKMCCPRGPIAQETSKLLSSLYDVRSKITHGDPDMTRAFNRVVPRLTEIRILARKALVNYFTFLFNHNHDQWRQHINDTLFE